MSKNILSKTLLFQKIDLSLCHIDAMKLIYFILNIAIMKKNHLVIFFSLITIQFLPTIFLSAQINKSLPQLGKNPIKEVVAAMTTDEKINLVVGTGMKFPGLPKDMQGPVVGETRHSTRRCGYNLGNPQVRYSFYRSSRWASRFKNSTIQK